MTWTPNKQTVQTRKSFEGLKAFVRPKLVVVNFFLHIFEPKQNLSQT